MFFGLENTQKEIADLLSTMVEDGTLPSSMLFCGPEYSSRMYASLCVAKALESDGDSTVILSERNSNWHILTALNLFKENRNKASSLFLYDTIDCYLKQFHGAMIDSQSSSGRKKFSDAADTMELLSQLPSVHENDVPAYCDSLKKAVSSILDFNRPSSQFRNTSLTVDQVRAIKDWCSTSSLEGKPKVVIIEGIENASVSVSNALLKTLEEPPQDTHFILISSNSSRIPATILSRLRKFDFKPFGKKEKDYILNSLFVHSSDYESLEDFFIARSGIDTGILKNEAHKLLCKEKIDYPNLISAIEHDQTWFLFFDYVVRELEEKMKQSAIDYKRGNYLVSEIRNTVSKGFLYNTAKIQIFEFVVYRVKEVL